MPPKPVQRTKLKLPQPSPCEDLTIGEPLEVTYQCSECGKFGKLIINVPDTMEKLQARMIQEALISHSMVDLLCEKTGFVLHTFHSPKDDKPVKA